MSDLGRLSASDYLDFLKTTPGPDHVFEGLVKPGEQPGELYFSPDRRCERWVPLKTADIEYVDHVGWVGCGDHVHALARVKLPSPQSADAKVFAALALHAHASPAVSTEILGGLCWDPATNSWVPCP